MKNLKIKIIKKYLRPYKRELFIGSIALLLVNILSVIIPLEVKSIIDQLRRISQLNLLFLNPFG